MEVTGTTDSQAVSKGGPKGPSVGPNVPILRAFWYLFDGIWGRLKGSWGVLVYDP